MTSDWLAFRPRDTIFIRDGRSFNAAADSTAHPVRPGPAMVAGAVGAAYGGEPDEVRGPVLALGGTGWWEPYFPAPADLVVPADAATPLVVRMRPEPGMGATDLAGAWGPAGAGSTGDGPGGWLMAPEDIEPVQPAGGWLPGENLAAYLAGELPAAAGTRRDKLGLVDDPLQREQRVGLARDADRQARTGYLYQATHLRADDGWAVLAECVLKPGWGRSARGPVNFGGRARLADVGPADVSWPAHPAGSVRERVVVYLATPALWPEGWLLPVPPGARLVAAATGEPEAVATMTPGSGWRDTRALRWAVPAGSVYLLEFAGPGDGAGWAAKVHGTAYGPDTSGMAEADRTTWERLRTAGFGVVLTGVWK